MIPSDHELPESPTTPARVPILNLDVEAAEAAAGAAAVAALSAAQEQALLQAQVPGPFTHHKRHRSATPLACWHRLPHSWEGPLACTPPSVTHVNAEECPAPH